MAVKEQELTKSGLILDSLEVKNFRAFKHLTIEKLGRVNLITGKNNVGKTSLLEALWLYGNAASTPSIRRLLVLRDELARQVISRRFGSASQSTPANEAQIVQAVGSLFHGEHELFSELNTITIGRLGDLEISLRLAWYLQTLSEDNAEAILTPIRTTDVETFDARPYLVVRSLGTVRRVKLERLARPLVTTLRRPSLPCEALWTSSRISTSSKRLWGQCNIPSVNSSRLPRGTGQFYRRNVALPLWEEVVSNDLESAVTSAMQSIIPRVRKIMYLADEDAMTEKPYLRLIGGGDPVPIQRFGEGVVRLLGILLIRR